MSDKPTEKQMKYIRDLQHYRVGVPIFKGKTKKDASAFISKYCNSPYRNIPFYGDSDDAYMCLPDEGYYC